MCSEMIFIGLLTHRQKQAGYFVSQQDEEFIFLWCRRNGNPDIIAVFYYPTATVKEIRDTAQKHLEGVLFK